MNEPTVARVDYKLYSTNIGAIYARCFKPIDSPKFNGTDGFWIPDINHLEPKGIIIANTPYSDYEDKLPDWAMTWIALEFWDAMTSSYNDWGSFLAISYYENFVVIRSDEDCEDHPEGSIINPIELHCRLIDDEDWR
jgi:hypothetical protein